MKYVLEKISVLFCKLKNGILQIVGSNLLNKIIAMLSNMIITRLMTKNDYGTWTYVCNIYSYLTLVTGLGLISGALQFGSENKGKKEEFQYYKFCIEAGLIIDTVLIVGFLVSTYFVTFKIVDSVKYIRLISFVLILEYIMNVLLNILRCENRIKEYASALNINTIVGAFLTCLGAFAGINGLLLARYLSVITALVYITYVIKPEFVKIIHTSRISFKKTASLWKYSLATGASSAMNCVLYLLDISMVATLIGDSEIVAVYRISTLIPNTLTFIPSSVIIAIMPQVIYNKDNPNWLRKKVRHVYLGLGVINFFIVVFLLVFAHWIILILNGKKYLTAVPLLRVLSIGYFISGTFRSLSTNLLAAKHYVGLNLIISIVSITCDIVFNYVLINSKGMMGAAYATFLVEVISSIIGFSFFIYVAYIKAENKTNFIDKI